MLSRISRHSARTVQRLAPSLPSLPAAAPRPSLPMARPCASPVVSAPVRAVSTRPFRASRSLGDWHQFKDPKTGEFKYRNIFTDEITDKMPSAYLAWDAPRESGMMGALRNDRIEWLERLGRKYNWRTYLIFFGVIGAIAGAEIMWTRHNAPTEEEASVDKEVARRVQEARARAVAENQASHRRMHHQ